MSDRTHAKELEAFAREIEEAERMRKVHGLQPDAPKVAAGDEAAEETEHPEIPIYGDSESNRRYLERFMKSDDAKPPLAILFDTSKALEGTARVMAFGAKKYDRKNWAKVDDRERYVSAELRHIAAHCGGERADKESGLDHLDHAIASLMFVSELVKRD